MIMSLRQQTLNFSSPREAEGWFAMLRTQWVVIETDVMENPTTGWYLGTAKFEVRDGHLVPAQAVSVD